MQKSVELCDVSDISLAHPSDFIRADNDCLGAGDASKGEGELVRAWKRRFPGNRWNGRLEESLYWLLSSALLIYFILDLLGH